jgi:hypothetical protein
MTNEGSDVTRAFHRPFELLSLCLLIGVEHRWLLRCQPWQDFVQLALDGPVPEHQDFLRIDMLAAE